MISFLINKISGCALKLIAAGIHLEHVTGMQLSIEASVKMASESYLNLKSLF